MLTQLHITTKVDMIINTKITHHVTSILTTISSIHFSSLIHSCFMFHLFNHAFFFLIWLVSQYWSYSQTLFIKLFSPTPMPTHYCSIKASYKIDKWMFSYTHVLMQTWYMKRPNDLPLFVLVIFICHWVLIMFKQCKNLPF